MALRQGYIAFGQSNLQGVQPIANAPVGVFSGNVLTGVEVFKTASGFVPFNVTDIGPSGNGMTYVGVGSSSSGNYGWLHIVLSHLADTEDVVIVPIAEGGSCLSLKTLLNGSHNTDVATLAGTYPTTPILHTALVNKFNSTVSQIATDGDTIEWKGCFIDLEEGDFTTPSTREADMIAKIAAIRTLTGNANLPVYWVSRIIDSNFFSQFMLSENKTVDALTANNYFITCIDGATTDGAHFNPETILSRANSVIEAIDGTQLSIPNVSLTVPNIIGKDYDYLAKAVEYGTITDDTQIATLEDFIIGTQSDGTLDKIVSGTFCLGSNYTFNVKNVGFRNYTANGVTSGADGFVFDGVNDYLSTGFRGSDIQAIQASDFSVFAYLKNNSIVSGNQCIGGWNATEGNQLRLYSNFTQTVVVSGDRPGLNLGATTIYGDKLLSNGGLFTGISKSNVIRIYKNEKLFGQVAYTPAFVNNLLEFGVDRAGGDTRWLNNTVPFLGYGYGMTQAQVESFSARVNTAITALGRNATPSNPIPLFDDLIAYANGNGITLPGTPFLTKLETFMDTYGEVLRNFVYLCIGQNDGTASAFANLNIIAPGTYTMTFPNSVTYGAGGWALDGVNQYGQNTWNCAVNSDEKYNLNQASRVAWVGAVTSGTAIDGTATGSRNNMTLSSSTSQRINGGSTALPSAFDMSGTGLKIITRLDEATVELANGATEATRAVAAATLQNETQFMGRSGTSYLNGTFKCYGVGWRLNAADRALLRTGLTNLFS